MNQWHNCPNLAAFWYNTISAVLYFYTLYTSAVRYHNFRTNINNPRYGQDWNDSYLLLHLAAILLASLLWMLFVFASLFKTGSLANDNVEMNTYRTVIGTPHITWSVSLILKKIMSRLYYHLIPFNSTIHLCGAFFLLVPIPLIIEEEVKHGIINYDNYPINFLLTTYTTEFINFIMAAVSLTVRLPTVFLSASTQISIIFSCILFISNSNILICCIFQQLLPLEAIKCDIVEMGILAVVLMVFVIFNYGLIYEMARTSYIDISYSSRNDTPEQLSNKSGANTTKRPKFLRYWHNFLSAIFLALSVILNIYQARSFSGTMPLFYFYITSTMLHYLSWLITLILFTLKIDWHFKFILIPRKRDYFSCDSSLQNISQNLKPTETIYTCFQQNDAVRSVSVGSSRTPNHDFSPTSSSSGSHGSERVASYKHIPSISKTLEAYEQNYEDTSSYRNSNRPGINILQEITEENSEQIGYFKSPNISQRSSNIHSSDSGIVIMPRDNTEYHMQIKSPGCDLPRGRPTILQRQFAPEYEYNEDLIGAINICSDV